VIRSADLPDREIFSAVREEEFRRDVLQIVWEEKDGPVVAKPASRGFGTRSVIASIESQLGGKAEFDWRSEGLVCRLSVPLMQEAATRRPNIQHTVAVNGGGA
jgi:two-component sensor histidine kinase